MCEFCVENVSRTKRPSCQCQGSPCCPPSQFQNYTSFLMLLSRCSCHLLPRILSINPHTKEIIKNRVKRMQSGVGSRWVLHYPSRYPSILATKAFKPSRRAYISSDIVKMALPRSPRRRMVSLLDCSYHCLHEQLKEVPVSQGL